MKMSKLTAVMLLIFVCGLLSIQFVGISWKQLPICIIPLVIAFLLPNIHNKKGNNKLIK